MYISIACLVFVAYCAKAQYNCVSCGPFSSYESSDSCPVDPCSPDATQDCCQTNASGYIFSFTILAVIVVSIGACIVCCCLRCKCCAGCCPSNVYNRTPENGSITNPNQTPPYQYQAIGPNNAYPNQSNPPQPTIGLPNPLGQQMINSNGQPSGSWDPFLNLHQDPSQKGPLMV
jgi:hypothetical protein